MKLLSSIALFALLLNAVPVRAALTIPGTDGSDGVLNITANTVIDLSQAVTANWDANNSANAGKGVYDATKWAVVFKYSSVTIAASATVTFKNHASRAPVVWLVNGDVTIIGALSLDGQLWQAPPNLAEPGPGGFRGGSSFFTTGVGPGAGFGPGGGGSFNVDRAGGSYSTVGTFGSTTYGNPSLLPLIGGSGGGGDTDANPLGGGGGAGGGAILVAASGSIEVGGKIQSNGGDGGTGSPNNNHSGGGSGGGVRLLCNQFLGSGIVQALAGGGYRVGGLGRIRIERVTNNNTIQVTPEPSVVTLQDASIPVIWLPNDGPTARVVSIGAVTAPSDPRASFGTAGADVALPQVSTTPVIVETTNAEDASVVKVRVTPRANGNYTETTATLDSIVSANPLVIRWTANVPVNPGYSAVQVKVVRP